MKVAVLGSAIIALSIIVGISQFVLFKEYVFMRVTEILKINEIKRSSISEVTNQGNSNKNSRHSNQVYP